MQHIFIKKVTSRAKRILQKNLIKKLWKKALQHIFIKNNFRVSHIK
jgi:hypothetical protein